METQELQLKRAEYKTAKLSTLKNWKENPREIDERDFEKLVDLLKRYGLIRPLLVDGRDGTTVLGGNMRLRALRELGVKEVDIAVVKPSSDEEAIEMALIDNAEFGRYLKNRLQDLLETHNIDLSIRITTNSVRLGEFKIAETKKDPDDFNPDSVDTSNSPIEEGTMIRLGNHILICGDSTNQKVVEKLLGEKRADMIFTDPPYNVDYGATMKDKLRGTSDRRIMNDNLGANFYNFLFDALTAVKGKVRGDVYICMSSSELHTLYSAFTDAGGHWSTFLIWVKNTFTMGRSNYQRQYEPILYGWYEETSHFWSGARDLGDVIRQEDAYVDAKGNVYLKAENLSMDIWEFPKPTRNKEHPTMKPVGLVERAIKNSTEPTDIVLDMFGGSGTTLIACETTNRHCRMIELDPYYCEVIAKRWEILTGNEREYLNLEGTPDEQAK